MLYCPVDTSLILCKRSQPLPGLSESSETSLPAGQQDEAARIDAMFEQSDRQWEQTQNEMAMLVAFKNKDEDKNTSFVLVPLFVPSVSDLSLSVPLHRRKRVPFNGKPGAGPRNPLQKGSTMDKPPPPGYLCYRCATPGMHSFLHLPYLKTLFSTDLS